MSSQPSSPQNNRRDSHQFANNIDEPINVNLTRKGQLPFGYQSQTVEHERNTDFDGHKAHRVNIQSQKTVVDDGFSEDDLNIKKSVSVTNSDDQNREIHQS